MPRGTPELTQKRIIRAYETTMKSQQAIADEFGVSLPTVKWLTKDRVRPAGKGAGEVAEVKMAAATSAVAKGAEVKIDGIDVTEYLKTAIADMSAGMAGAETKSKEGAAIAYPVDGGEAVRIKFD